MMNGSGKSDRPIVPRKPPNKAAGAPAAAEGVEERGLAKGNPRQFPRSRTQSRGMLRRKLWRIRQVAKRRKKEQFTALWHHIYNPNRLHEVYWAVNRSSAPGVDRVTWKQYGEQLWGNLTDLAGRLVRGAYRPKPVERTYVPKADGRQRPIGKPVLEDKIVQRAYAEVVGEVFEAEFLGFSYGFRPGRSQHDALDALTVGLERRRVNWVLDADIRGYFDAIDHEWLQRFLEHRISDRRVLRQAREWLQAGVLEEGELCIAEKGTPQGGSVSPLLANIYLHYVFDLWADRWRKQRVWLSAVLAGHYQYYGVPRNNRALRLFYNELVWHWWRALRRRSHKHRLKWKNFVALARERLPQPKITHPYPDQRLCVTT